MTTEIKTIGKGAQQVIEGWTDDVLAKSLRSVYITVNAYRRELQRRGFTVHTYTNGPHHADSPEYGTIGSITISKEVKEIITL